VWTPLKCARLAILPGLLLSLTFAAVVERVGIAQRLQPTATLSFAPTLRLPGAVDSNSPAVWTLEEGEEVLHVLTSDAGQPSVASGIRLSRLGETEPVSFSSHPGHGVWMEAVVADHRGTWYGYYHNEVPADVCGRPDRVLPRIGAARSRDNGRTWQNLGIVLEAPAAAYDCGTDNRYFVGGIGDLSVMLDPESKHLYLFFSQYSSAREAQGVAVGRLLWARRDWPVGRVDVWSDNAWLPVTPLAGSVKSKPLAWQYPAGTPLVAPRRPWHDADPVNDAYWGPSVHWNTHLEQYVMLLNRAKDESFGQEGIYVSFAPTLENPRLWTPPQRILAGGSWYPQVIGLEAGDGTDKIAGARARFFMGGTSHHSIEFEYR
jgi:hypothetical protein